MPTEKELLEREIAKLTGAIAGRGRNLNHGHSRTAVSRTAHPYQAQIGGNKTFRPASHSLVLNNTSKSTSSDKPASSSKIAPQPIGNGSNAYGNNEERWVNSTSRSGNKSLVNPEIYLQQQKARLAHTTKPKESRRSDVRLPRRAYDTTVSADGKKVVNIDGVVYEFEGDGKKLKRIEGMSEDQPEPEVITPTRSSFSISGQQYIRTRNGNLVRRKATPKKFAKDKPKSTQPCRYFTKTGACKRASTCPYIHDPNKISVCSKYLRGNCPHSDSACPVSHKPTPHNAPSCVHFQRTGQCRNGKDCRYPHIKVSDDAPVCLDFSIIGWCDRGSACLERHAWECREYSETGTCARGKKCELMHILRAKKPIAEDEAAAKDGMDMSGTALPDGLFANRVETSSEGEMDDDDEDEDEDSQSVNTEDEADDVIAGQQDFIQFQAADDGPVVSA